MIKDAEERGLLTPGKPGTIVESTAGNTGISLAEIGRSRGYRCVIVIPETQSQEKKDALVYAGAELVQVAPRPLAHPNNYINVGRRLAEKLDRAVFMDQFDNRSNRMAHVMTTGPEIWKQLDGKVDGFSCAVGTGGTLSGTAEYLRMKNGSVKIGLTDPCGAKLVRFFECGQLEAHGNSITEGIGQGRVTGNLQGFRPDYAFEIPDDEALEAVYGLMKEEGLCLGTSSGINVAGAIRMAQEMGPGHNIVTVLCDLGTRYTGKMFNLEFLDKKGLPKPEWIGAELSDDVKEGVEQSTVEEDV